MATAIVGRHRRIVDHIIDGIVITIDHGWFSPYSCLAHERLLSHPDPVPVLAAEAVRALDVVSNLSRRTSSLDPFALGGERRRRSPGYA